MDSTKLRTAEPGDFALEKGTSMLPNHERRSSHASHFFRREILRTHTQVDLCGITSQHSASIAFAASKPGVTGSDITRTREWGAAEGPFDGSG